MQGKPRWIFVLLAALGACRGYSDPIADVLAARDAGAKHDSSQPSDRDSGAPVKSPSGRDAFCNGSGGLLIAPGASASPTPCSGQLASQAFRYALCTCSNLATIGALTTDSFDSRQGPYLPSIPLTTGGAVGINGSFLSGGVNDIGGNLTVAGREGLASPVYGVIRGDLRVRGPVSLVGSLEVTGDAWLADALVVAGKLEVRGDLRQETGAARGGSAMPDTIVIDGQDVREHVSVEAPCACAEDELLDVVRIVAEAKLGNHNAELGVDSAMFANLLVDRSVALQCGRVFVSTITVLAEKRLTLTITGRTAVFVEGDLMIAGALSLQLAADAELDLFVAGNVSLNSLQNLGSGAGRVHLYVGGRSVTLFGSGDLVGSLYAPRAIVSLVGPAAVYGSIVAGDFIGPSALAIHYDSALLHAGDSCDPQPKACRRCTDCNATTACLEGQCGACTSDADCCQPLVCVQGECTVEL